MPRKLSYSSMVSRWAARSAFRNRWSYPWVQTLSQDRKFLSKYRLEWHVPYAPGDLKAVAYRNGKQVALDEVRTAGAAAQVKLTADRTTIQADGQDLSFLTVRIEDAEVISALQPITWCNSRLLEWVRSPAWITAMRLPPSRFKPITAKPSVAWRC